MLICITGGDGAGKSTLISGLKAVLEEQGKKVLISSPWDIHKKFSKVFELPKEDKSQIQKYLYSCESASRVHFLFHANLQALNDRLKEDHDVILIDSYWYKYAVIESLIGTDIEEIKKTAALMPEPDKVFYLNLDSNEALKRKKALGLTKYETGGKEGEEGEQFFLSIQEKSRKVWESLVKSNWSKIDASLSPEDVLKEVHSNIE